MENVFTLTYERSLPKLTLQSNFYSTFHFSNRVQTFKHFDDLIVTFDILRFNHIIAMSLAKSIPAPKCLI